MIKVKARGLDGFSKDLQVAETRLIDGMRDLMSELADETASDARNKARPGKLSGDSMDSIRAQGPVVRAGDAVPWYGFADFGGTTGIKRSVKRKYIKGGRWLFPAVADVGVTNRAEKMVERATEDLR
jgi:hypothetical protein